MDVTFTVSGETFEWDEDKAASNVGKHGVGFVEATEAFFDPLYSVDDAPPDTDEDRLVLIGNTIAGRLLYVVFVNRGDRVRLISARDPTRRERKDYEQYR